MALKPPHAHYTHNYHADGYPLLLSESPDNRLISPDELYEEAFYPREERIGEDQGPLALEARTYDPH